MIRGRFVIYIYYNFDEFTLQLVVHFHKMFDVKSITHIFTPRSKSQFTRHKNCDSSPSPSHDSSP